MEIKYKMLSESSIELDRCKKKKGLCPKIYYSTQVTMVYPGILHAILIKKRKMCYNICFILNLGNLKRNVGRGGEHYIVNFTEEDRYIRISY